MFYTESKLSDVYDYIINNRGSAKRTVFDLKHLQEWLYWSYSNDYLFFSKKDGKVNGVIIVIPVGNFDKLPTIQELIQATNKHYSNETTDYFIMDALVDNSEIRLHIAKLIKERFPRMVTDAKTYVQKGSKIWIIEPKHNSNFTKY